jgi:hypothetical protein
LRNETTTNPRRTQSKSQNEMMTSRTPPKSC